MQYEYLIFLGRFSCWAHVLYISVDCVMGVLIRWPTPLQACGVGRGVLRHQWSSIESKVGFQAIGFQESIWSVYEDVIGQTRFLVQEKLKSWQLEYSGTHQPNWGHNWGLRSRVYPKEMIQLGPQKLSALVILWFVFFSGDLGWINFFWDLDSVERLLEITKSDTKNRLPRCTVVPPRSTPGRELVPSTPWTRWCEGRSCPFSRWLGKNCNSERMWHEGFGVFSHVLQWKTGIIRSRYSFRLWNFSY